METFGNNGFCPPRHSNAHLEMWPQGPGRNLSSGRRINSALISRRQVCNREDFATGSPRQVGTWLDHRNLSCWQGWTRYFRRYEDWPLGLSRVSS